MRPATAVSCAMSGSVAPGQQLAAAASRIRDLTRHGLVARDRRLLRDRRLPFAEQARLVQQHDGIRRQLDVPGRAPSSPRPIRRVRARCAACARRSRRAGRPPPPRARSPTSRKRAVTALVLVPKVRLLHPQRRADDGRSRLTRSVSPTTKSFVRFIATFRGARQWPRTRRARES